MLSSNRAQEVYSSWHSALHDDHDDTRFHDDRVTAQLSFSFSPGERTTFIQAYLDEYVRSADTKLLPSEMKLTSDELRRCWREARGFNIADDVVEDLEQCFPVGVKRSSTDPAAASSQQHPEPTESSDEKTKSKNSGDVAYLPLLLFARSCTLNPLLEANMPFPMATSSAMKKKYKDIRSLLYFVPFLVLLTYFLGSGKGLSQGYFVHHADFDTFADQLYDMPCRANECNETAVRNLNVFEIKNTTEYYQWLRRRVITQLWTTPGKAAVNPIRFSLFPVGALRLVSFRVDGTQNNWQHQRYFADQNPTAADQQLIDRIFSTAEGGYGRAYPESDGTKYSKASFKQAQVVNASALTQQGFRYSRCDIPSYIEDAPYFRGDVGIYACGGFIVTIPYNATREEALLVIDELEALQWIDKQTRGAFVYKTLFNKDAQLFHRSVVGFEMSNGGYWQLLRRSYIYDFFTFSARSKAWVGFFSIYILWLGCYILFFVFNVCMKTGDLARAMGYPLSSARRCFSCDGLFVAFVATVTTFRDNPWFIVDLVNYIFFIVVWMWRIYLWRQTPTFYVQYIHEYPVNLDAYSNDTLLLDYLDALNALISYLKLFKYFRQFRVLNQLLETIVRSAVDLYGLLFTAIVLIIAFALCGHVAYGGLIAEFSTVERSIPTLLRFVIGDFDYEGWDAARRVVAPAFLTVLQIFLVIILMNAVTAVIADNFGDVVGDEFKEEDIIEMAEADPSCRLRIDFATSALRNPIVFEIRAKVLVLITAIKWLIRKIRKEDATKESELQYLVDRCRADPKYMWEWFNASLHSLYYGARTEGAAANEQLRDLAGLLSQELEPASHMFADRKRRASRTIRRGSLYNTADCRSIGSSGVPKFKKLENHVYQQLGDESDFLLHLFVAMPHAVMGAPRAEALVNLLRYQHTWLNEVGATIPNVGTLTVNQLSIPDDIAQSSEMSSSSVGSRSMTQSALTLKETVIGRLRAVALFGLLPKTLVDEAFRPGKAESERRVLIQEEWQKLQNFWREYYDAPFLTTEDEALHLVIEGGDSETVETLEQIGRHRNRVVDHAVRSTFSVQWSASMKNRAKKQVIRKFCPEGATAIDNSHRLNVEDFSTVWRKSTGTQLNKDVRCAVQQLSALREDDAAPENAQVRTNDFLMFCGSSSKAHSKRSFQHEFYARERHKFFNVLELMLHLPLLLLFTIVLLYSGLGKGAYVSLAVKAHATDGFRSPNMRTYEEIADRPMFKRWFIDNIVERYFRPEGQFSMFVGDVNFAVGAIAIRQTRSKLYRECGFPKSYQTKLTTDPDFYNIRVQEYFQDICVPRWGRAEQDTTDVVPRKNTSDVLRPAFVYRECGSRSTIIGRTGTFACHGHTFFMPMAWNRTYAMNVATTLIDSEWIDEQTRGFIVDVLVYNFNADYFSRTQFLIEATAGGVWVPQRKQDSFQLFTSDSYSGGFFFLVAIFLLVLVINMVVFLSTTVSRVRTHSERFALSLLRAFVQIVEEDIWWWMDLVNYVVFIFVWALRFASFGLSKNAVRLFDTVAYPDNLVAYSEIAYALTVMDCINALLVYVKIFYFVRLHPRLNILPVTLAKASRNMFSILVISFSLLTAFVLVGHIVFGAGVLSMSSVSRTFQTMSLTVFGDDDFDNLFRDKPVFSVIYFTAFVIICVSLMLNMVISVLQNAYGEAKDESFKPTRFRSIAAVDPTVLGSTWSESMHKNPFVEEIKYWGRSTHARVAGSPSDALRARLRCQRTFYSLMAQLTLANDSGSAAQMSIAATNLLIVMYHVDRMHAEHTKEHCSVAIWDPSRHHDSNDLAVQVFGLPRPRLLDYAKELFVPGTFDEASFWCIELPTRSLRQTIEAVTIGVLEHNNAWKQEAKFYIDIEGASADADGEQQTDEAEDQFETAIAKKMGELTSIVDVLVSRATSAAAASTTAPTASETLSASPSKSH
mgnify:FL=1